MTKTTSSFDFFRWFDDVQDRAYQSTVGKIMAEAGYEIAHTGGGCLCWEKVLKGERYLWICDEGNGLGDKVDEVYLVGLYNLDGDILDQGEVLDLREAITWCAIRSVKD